MALPRQLHSRRRWAVLVAALVLLGALVAGLSVIGGRGETSTSIDWAYAPQAARRYLTVGTNDDRQFSDAELATLAEDYSVVVLTKFHGGWDIQRHHEAARRLKQLNPDLDVFAYMSTKYWFDANRWEDEIDPAWLLRDDEGDLIPVTSAAYNPDSKRLGHYIDVTNPAYREWLLGVAKRWLAAAPYDGIRFDAADHIGDYGEHNVAFWRRLLSPDRIQAYNDGIDTLLQSFDEELEPHRVFYNGISPGATRGEDRGLSTLAFTDGAMDELFCGTQGDVVADIEIMERYSDRSLQMHMPADPDDIDADTLRHRERYCVASFLLGWQPGSTRFSMGKGYAVDQLDEQPMDIDLDLGAPLGPHSRTGDVLQRSFEHGTVYVNVGTDPASLTLPEPLTRVAQGRSYGSYEEYTLDGEDAVFFLTERFVAAGSAAASG